MLTKREFVIAPVEAWGPSSARQFHRIWPQQPIHWTSAHLGMDGASRIWGRQCSCIGV
jgi:hypothetical protein